MQSIEWNKQLNLFAAERLQRTTGIADAVIQDASADCAYLYLAQWAQKKRLRAKTKQKTIVLPRQALSD